jgi:hypothetical protein
MPSHIALSCNFISLFQKVRPETPSEINGDYKSCELLHKFISKKATATQILRSLLFQEELKIFVPP